MGIATYGREDGWSFIDDVLSSPGRGNGRWINNKISYDAFEAGIGSGNVISGLKGII